MASKMKKMLGSFGSRKPADGDTPSTNGSSAGPLTAPTGDSPEDIVVREVIAFCESGAPGSNAAGEEYLHLPAIVDGAESSPSAAREAAGTIQKYLGKSQYGRGYAQYNAIMLTRILTDNPGRNFTQNFDKDFVATIKKLLRESQDASVQQICRENLDYFEVEKEAQNDSLKPLMSMWRREKGLGAQLHPQHATMAHIRGAPTLHRGASQPPLPPPEELASRIEEAKTTARLLVQTIQSTPVAELQSNELIREFAHRSRAAQRSISSYMACENPRPDDDTMMTLIETNEQLNIALTKYERTKLQARRANSGDRLGSHASPSPSPNPQARTGAGALGDASATAAPAERSAFGQAATNGYGYNPPAGPPPGTGDRDRRSDPVSAVSAGPNSTSASMTVSAPSSDNPFSDESAIDSTGAAPNHLRGGGSGGGAGAGDWATSTSYSLFAARPTEAHGNGPPERI